jgi:hypothetical protein
VSPPLKKSSNGLQHILGNGANYPWGTAVMPSSRTSEVHAASEILVATLRAQREQGPGTYPTSLQQLLDRTDQLTVEQKAKAVKHRSFLQQVVLARKKDVQAPVVLLEDLPVLASSDALLEYLLAAVVTAKKWKWPVPQLAGKVEKGLQAAFRAALDDRLQRGVLPAGVGVVSVRGQPHFYLRAQVPEAGGPLLLADTLIRQLRVLREERPAEYPTTVEQLAGGLLQPPPLEQVRKAVLESPFKDNALLAVPKNLAAPVVLREDLDRLASSPLLLDFLLRSVCHAEHEAAALADLKKKLDKKVQRAFEQNLLAQLAGAVLPSDVGWLTIKKTKYLFFVRDVHRGSAVGNRFPIPNSRFPIPDSLGDIIPEQFDKEFAAAFDRLDQQRGSHNFVSLLDLRRELPYRRDVVDGHIQHLRHAGRYAMSAVEGRHGISEEELAAAIPEEDSLLLYVSRLREPEPEQG